MISASAQFAVCGCAVGYYAQLTLEDEHNGQKQVRRVVSEGATTSAQARQRIEEL